MNCSECGQPKPDPLYREAWVVFLSGDTLRVKKAQVHTIDEFYFVCQESGWHHHYSEVYFDEESAKAQFEKERIDMIARCNRYLGQWLDVRSRVPTTFEEAFEK